MKLIEAAWLSYLREVIPAGAPTVQIVESRRAFYAGAQATFRGIVRMLDPGVEPTDADLAKMHALDAELREFAASVGSASEERGPSH